MRIIIKLCSSGSHYLVSYIKQNYKLMNRNSQRKPVNTLKKIGLNPFEIPIENEELTSMCTSM